jgi:hypothetical protein
MKMPVPLCGSSRTRSWDLVRADRMSEPLHLDEVRDHLTLEQIIDMVVAIAKIQGDSCYLEPISPGRARRPSPTE